VLNTSGKKESRRSSLGRNISGEMEAEEIYEKYKQDLKLAEFLLLVTLVGYGFFRKVPKEIIERAKKIRGEIEGRWNQNLRRSSVEP